MLQLTLGDWVFLMTVKACFIIIVASSASLGRSRGLGTGTCRATYFGTTAIAWKPERRDSNIEIGDTEWFSDPDIRRIVKSVGGCEREGLAESPEKLRIVGPTLH